MSRANLRPQMWAAIRRLGADGRFFTLDDIRGALRGPVKRERVRDYLKALVAGGYLEPVVIPGQVTDKPGLLRFKATPAYRLIRDPGAEAPRVRADGSPVTQGQGREAMWRTLRILGVCTLRELVATASTPDWTITESEARDYCDRLARVGFLARESGPSGRRYWLFPGRYTGPRPPQIRRNKQVWDPNTNTLYSPAGEILGQGARHD